MRAHRFIVLTVVVGSLVSGCSHPQASEAKPPQPVQSHTVTAMPAQSGVRYSASIEAFEQVPLSFKSAGYVDAVLRRPGADGKPRAAQPGDRIAKGTVLARVREDDFRDRVNQSRARLAEAEASVVKTRLDLDRARTLFRAESLTKPELDAAQAAFDTADARMAAARADIELAVSAARDTALVSPADGVILERRIEVGSLATTGTVAFVLGDLSSVKARLGIPDAMIEAIALGDPIEVMVEAVAAAKFTGRVTAIAPAADEQSRVFDVEITIPNTNGRLRPGMIGTVTLGPAGDAHAGAIRSLAVPLTAVVRSEAADARFAVLVIEREHGADVVRRRRVELGDVIGNLIAVTEGLIAGERVVGSGAALLADGEPVRVIQ
jgi:membrane fusion protein, multidrug efflux system